LSEWVKTVAVDEVLKTTDATETDVGRSVVSSGNGRDLGYGRALLRAPARGARVRACDCGLWSRWWGDC
jgi:hypothetical protein